MLPANSTRLQTPRKEKGNGCGKIRESPLPPASVNKQKLDGGSHDAVGLTRRMAGKAAFGSFLLKQRGASTCPGHVFVEWCVRFVRKLPPSKWCGDASALRNGPATKQLDRRWYQTLNSRRGGLGHPKGHPTCSSLLFVTFRGSLFFAAISATHMTPREDTKGVLSPDWIKPHKEVKQNYFVHW